MAEFSFPTKGGSTTKLWMDYEEYLHMLDFKEECEMYYWYGQKTYDSNGHTYMKDENGQPVIVGPGLLEQIVETDTYSTMTETKLKNIIGDLFYSKPTPDPERPPQNRPLSLIHISEPTRPY